jgi:hypothetical protein
VIPLWVAELATRFWAEAGGTTPFPRDLEPPIARALPLVVISLPQLTVHGVASWLDRQNLPARLPTEDRSLRACLVARNGCGLAFLDKDDPEDERRFSLAHEVAHFLRDYRHPRQRAAARLGSDITAVLDGHRAARPEERLHALLSGVSLGFSTHLFERNPSVPLARSIVEAEWDADCLAYELLAPAQDILRERDEYAERVRRLRESYGLPTSQAEAYARLLAPPVPPAHPLLLRLRKNF